MKHAFLAVAIAIAAASALSDVAVVAQALAPLGKVVAVLSGARS